MVVEAVEVVRDPDRVRRQRVRRPSLGRLGDESGKFEQPLDELPLLVLERRRELGLVARATMSPRSSAALRRIPAIRAWAYWT